MIVSVCQEVRHMWAACNLCVCKAHTFYVEHLLKVQWDYLQGQVKVGGRGGCSTVWMREEIGKEKASRELLSLSSFYKDM